MMLNRLNINQEIPSFVLASNSKHDFLIQSESFNELDVNQIKEESFKTSKYY
jgi:hypothetical protein